MRKLLNSHSEALRHPILRRLVLANFISLTGDAATLIALPLLVLKVTESASHVALTLTAIVVGTIFGAQVLHPRLRIHPRKLAQWADVFQGLLILSIVVLSYLPHFQFTVLIAAFLSAVSLSFHRNSEQIIIKEAVESAGTHLSINFNALYELSTYLGRTCGPLLVGLIFFWGNVKHALILDACTFFISAWVLQKINFHHEFAPKKQSLRLTLSGYPQSHLALYLGVPFVIQTALSLYSATVVIHLTQVLATNEKMIAVYNSIEAIALLLGAFVAPQLAKRKFILPFAILLEAIGYFGFFMAGNFWLFLASDFIVCFGLGIGATFLRNNLQSMLDKQHISSVMGLRLTLMNTAKMFGFLFASIWLLNYSTTPLYLISSVMLGISAFFALKLSSSEQKLNPERVVNE